MKYMQQVFTKANLETLLSAGQIFEGIDFLACDFQGGDLSRFTFDNCQFKNCNLSLIVLNNTKLTNCQFKDCKMTAIDWTKLNPVFRLYLKN
ncbi:MAG: pentapeptide repeat-containing protein [bacterium]